MKTINNPMENSKASLPNVSSKKLNVSVEPLSFKYKDGSIKDMNANKYKKYGRYLIVFFI